MLDSSWNYIVIIRLQFIVAGIIKLIDYYKGSLDDDFSKFAYSRFAFIQTGCLKTNFLAY